MNVDDVLRSKGRQVYWVAPDLAVRDAADYLAARGIGAVVVASDQSTMHGIISERDIAGGLGRLGADIATESVRNFMNENVITCEPTHSIAEVASVMIDNGIRHIVVVAEDKLVGVISIRDLVRERLTELESENAELRKILVDLD